MAPRKEEALRKAKEAKQKKLLIVLAPLFLGLVVWQGPKMYTALFSPPPPPSSAAAQTTAAPADPGTAPTAQVAGATTTPMGTNGLPDTDPTPAASSDRLVSFSRFTGRDPFGDPNGESGSAEGAAPEDSGSTPSQAAESAVISVNGASETVSVNGEFPADDPTFRLVSLTADKAVVGLVTGSFEGDEETVELSVGEELTLVAEPDGTRYTLKLVSIG